MTVERTHRRQLSRAAATARAAQLGANSIIEVLSTFALMALIAAFALVLSAPAFAQANDAYRPPAQDSYGAPPAASDYGAAPQGETYEPYQAERSGGSGYGEPYAPPSGSSRSESYEQLPPEGGGGATADGEDRGTYTQNEIVRAGHGFFGSISSGLASAIEWAFKNAGRPNGYILGQDAGGALVAGLRYGEGSLHTKDAGNHRVYWQGPTIGYDAGAEGSKVMVLVYNLRDPAEIYQRFGGVQGAAYLVGGVSVQLQKAGNVTLAPIRAGVGVRLGANVGYLKYSREPTWNPF